MLTCRLEGAGVVDLDGVVVGTVTDAVAVEEGVASDGGCDGCS